MTYSSAFLSSMNMERPEEFINEYSGADPDLVFLYQTEFALLPRWIGIMSDGWPGFAGFSACL
ncbi:hypothetical protein C3R74_10740 [Acidithiobacillus ferridurans]|jgi:hypothetical protein|uniref:Uncharacterized protein n=2 Tax=Bacteria TaxID=2 RepID=B7JB39_ACIF2|nr:hypothetical protein AFE_1702 [Acidithiobacillus ferrooxidans ATCC 23270]RBL99544.1 hypothetical protein C3R74_10740 [Acidithiobacillus ferridurans]